MKKALLMIALCGVLAFSLTACGHSHKWKDATCTTPKMCTECDATEGEPLGHTVKLGLCGTCDEVVGQDIITEAFSAYEYVLHTVSASVDTINGVVTKAGTGAIDPDGAQAALAGVAGDLSSATTLGFEAFADEFGEEQGDLGRIAASMTAAIKALPKAPASNDVDTLNAFIADFKTFGNRLSFLEDALKLTKKSYFADLKL